MNCAATKNGHQCHYKADHPQQWHFAVIIPNKYVCWPVEK